MVMSVSTCVLDVAPEIFDRIPGLSIVVAYAPGVDNRRERHSVQEDWIAAWTAAGDWAAAFPNPQSHPHVKAWGERLKAAGISRKAFPPSVEAVLRRAMKGGEPFFINPLVDFYNAVALRHVVPAGAFDLDHVGDAMLRTTREGDTFQALDAASPVAVPPGEVAYAAGSTILTRQLMWRQSQAGLVTPATTRVLIMSELLPEHPATLVDDVAESFREGFRRHFQVEAVVSRLDRGHPRLVLDDDATSERGAAP
jgi:DNA/RNA-binding domain of Phe-tRNA-synthetase-like protein